VTFSFIVLKMAFSSRLRSSPNALRIQHGVIDGSVQRRLGDERLTW
jgi:hypothetical protein